MDCLSEGIAMPLGALMMSIMVAYEIKPKTLLEELHISGTKKIDTFFIFCIYTLAPLGMALILLGQLDYFFGFGIF